MSRLFIIVGLFAVLTKSLVAQEYFMPLSNELNLRYEPSLQRVSSSAHTAMKPWLSKDLLANTPFDSLTETELKNKPFNKTLVGRKLFKEHFIQVNDDDVYLHVDPAFELNSGVEEETNRKIFTNSRGIWIGGTIGKRFSFDATFYENLAKFPTYLDSFARQTGIAPGQGRVKK